MPVLSQLFFAGRKDYPPKHQDRNLDARRILAIVVRQDRKDTSPESKGPESPFSSSLGTLQYLLLALARPAQFSEPILFPKLRIRFADFPYLHYSSDQRLFTLETCCGYGYGLTGNLEPPTWIFKGFQKCSGHRKSRGALRYRNPYLRLNRFQGLDTLTRRDNSPQNFWKHLHVGLRCRIYSKTFCNAKSNSPTSGSGLLTRFPFAKHRSQQ